MTFSPNMQRNLLEVLAQGENVPLLKERPTRHGISYVGVTADDIAIMIERGLVTVENGFVRITDAGRNAYGQLASSEEK